MERKYLGVWGSFQGPYEEMLKIAELFTDELLSVEGIRENYRRWLEKEEEVRSLRGKHREWYLEEEGNEIVLYCIGDNHKGIRRKWDAMRFIPIPEVPFAERLIEEFKRWSEARGYWFYRIEIKSDFTDDDYSLGTAVRYELSADERFLCHRYDVLQFFDLYFKGEGASTYELFFSDDEVYREAYWKHLDRSLYLYAFGYFRESYYDPPAFVMDFMVEEDKFIITYKLWGIRDVVVFHGYTVKDVLEKYKLKELSRKLLEKDTYTYDDILRIYEEISSKQMTEHMDKLHERTKERKRNQKKG